MKLTISDAARRAGVRRTTIYRKLNAGKLSRETDEDGNPVIDLSELTRIYPHAIDEPGHRPDAHRTPESGQNETASETAVLQARLELLCQEREREREQLEATVADLRHRLDQEAEDRRRVAEELHQSQAKLTALLTDQRPKRRWWRFGRQSRP